MKSVSRGHCWQDLARAAGVLGAALFVCACSVLIKSDVSRGIGASCASDGECHAGVCEQSVCTAVCSADLDCPVPSTCRNSRCKRLLTVVALYPGTLQDQEGPSAAHHEGLTSASERLGYVELAYEQRLDTKEQIAAKTDEYASQGADVIVGTSESQTETLWAKAPEYPETDFLSFDGQASNATNLSSVSVYLEQAYFVAGKIAAHWAKGRLGFIGTYISPRAVRCINAFTLGARSVNPNMVVEVRWIGWSSDYRPAPSEGYAGAKLYREEILVEQLVQSGCEVIAHLASNGRPVRRVDAMAGAGAKVASIAFPNRNGCRQRPQDSNPNKAYASCLGAVYYNMTSVYTRLLGDAYSEVLQPSQIHENMTSGTESVVGFLGNAAAGVDDSGERMGDGAYDGLARIFEGPYQTTGQRDADGDGAYDALQIVDTGQSPSDAELTEMCWFVKGVIERSDPTNLASHDKDALVPDSVSPAALDVLGPPGSARDEGRDCRSNHQAAR